MCTIVYANAHLYECLHTEIKKQPQMPSSVACGRCLIGLELHQARLDWLTKELREIHNPSVSVFLLIITWVRNKHHCALLLFTGSRDLNSDSGPCVA